MTTLPLSAAPPEGMLEVEVWSDIACPWCYIGKRRFARAVGSFEHRDRVRVTWRSYQLSPGARAGAPGSELELLARRKHLALEQVREMFDHVAALAAEEGLAYDFAATRPANTFDAHRLVHLATAQRPECADEVVEALMSAHFEQGVAVDDRGALVAIATRLGLDGERVRAALADEGLVGRADGDAAAGAVRADLAAARAIGVTGVPFFVLDGRLGVSGAQGTELFSQALVHAWSGLGGDHSSQFA